MGTLYLVSTPIGNMEDITLRAIRILGKVDNIACEDTRKTGLLLERLKISPKPKLISYYEENEIMRIPQIIDLLKKGQDIALVSNAGTPTISDPGYKLVHECLGQLIKVEAIPGPSAVLAALVSSGLPTDKFLFLGYLPKKPGKREKIWQLAKTAGVTTIIFESPHRLLKTLKEIQTVFSDIEIVVCRELTKVYEEICREKAFVKPKGELTLVFFQRRGVAER